MFDSPTRGVRPIIGLLGSAYLGPSVLNNLDAAWIAPHGLHGIAIRDEQVLLISALGSDRPGASILNGVVRQPQGVMWSADGSVAVLFSASGNWIQRFTNLPNLPAAGQTMDLSGLPGTVSAIASDAPARRIAIGIRAETGGGVYIASDDQSPVFRMPMMDPAALAFSSSEDILYAAERATGQLFELRNSGSQAIPGTQNGATDPVAIRSGEDAQGRRLLYVAGRADRVIRVYDAASYALLNELALETAPVGLEPLGDTSFLIAARAKDGDALWLLSGKPAAAVYFVPSPSGSLGGQQ